MGKLQKISCGCFGFLKRKSSTNEERPKKTENKNVSAELFFEPGHEEEFSIDHSLVTTQKILSPFHNFKSTIITPSCRTPQIHNIVQAVPQSENSVLRTNVKRNFNFLPNSIQHSCNEKPYLSALNDSMNKKRISSVEIKQKILFSGLENCDKKDTGLDEPSLNQEEKKTDNEIGMFKEIIEENNEEFEEIKNLEVFHKKTQDSTPTILQTEKLSPIKDEKSLYSIEKNNSKLESHNINKPEKDYSEPEDKSTGVSLKEKNPSKEITFLVSPILSPNIEMLDRSIKLTDKGFSLLEISPIKSVLSIDSYSDILAALNSPDQKNMIKGQMPDIFIRTTLKPKQLPHLKPTTPSHFSKNKVFPKFRKDNKIFLESLKNNL